MPNRELLMNSQGEAAFAGSAGTWPVTDQSDLDTVTFLVNAVVPKSDRRDALLARAARIAAWRGLTMNERLGMTAEVAPSSMVPARPVLAQSALGPAGWAAGAAPSAPAPTAAATTLDGRLPVRWVELRWPPPLPR
jgi:hypothetical protein